MATRAFFIHFTPFTELPYLVSAKLTSRRVLRVIFSEPMNVDDGSLYDINNYDIICPEGIEQLHVVSIWGYASYPYPYGYSYPYGYHFEQYYDYSYEVYSMYPEEGGMYSVFMLLDGDPVAGEDYILRVNTGDDGPIDSSGNHISTYGNTAHFTGMAIPELLSVEVIDFSTLELTWNAPIAPGDRDNPMFYFLSERKGDAVPVRVVSVRSDFTQNLSIYRVVVTRMSHRRRYIFNVIEGYLRSGEDWPITAQAVDFVAVGVIPSYTIMPENSNSILITFNQDMITTSGIRDMRNYVFDNDLRVTGIEVLDKRRVRLFTSTQFRNVKYKLQIGRISAI